MLPAPKAYMIHGFLGVGKTTFAKRLEKEQAAVRFTHDEWMVRFYGNDPPAEHFQEYARRVFETMEEVWTRCLDLGINVILDFGFWSQAEREYVQSLISRHGGKAVLYRLDCPEDVTWNWIEQRNKQAGSLYIAPATYRMLRARFEPLRRDEACIDVGTHQTPEAIAMTASSTQDHRMNGVDCANYADWRNVRFPPTFANSGPTVKSQF
ncbi:AAA family ATPase [Novosphingopyxis sp.]|uniref:AAA family ATPase n=1 Tax=Novosphingopyxis sp. TaxID=2709690 RepID=UPI003B5C70C8